MERERYSNNKDLGFAYLIFLIPLASIVIIGIAFIYEAVFIDVFFLSVFLGFLLWILAILISFVDLLKFVKKIIYKLTKRR